MAWAMLSYELEDAAEHLVELLRRMEERSDYGEPELRIDLGHVRGVRAVVLRALGLFDGAQGDPRWSAIAPTSA